VSARATHIITHNVGDLETARHFGINGDTGAVLNHIRGERMSELLVKVPEYLRKRAEAVAAEENISLDELVALALAKLELVPE